MLYGLLKTERRQIGAIAITWLIPIAVYYFVQSFFEYGMPDGDVYLYHRLALQLTQGQIPFVDYFFEYPPASILIFAIPALFSTVVAQYVVLYQILSWVAMLVICYCMLGIHSALGIQTISKRNLFALATVYSWLLIQIAVNRFDTFAALFTILGLTLYMQGIQRNYVEYRTLGILSILFAALIKLYPVFLLPFIGLYEVKNFNSKAFIYHISASILFLLPFLAWMLVGYRGLLFFLGYHSDRGLEIESTWATFVMAGNQLFGWFEYNVVYEFASFGIRGPFADLLANLSLKIYAGMLVVAAVLFLLKVTKDNATELLMHVTSIVCIGFPTFNKVFSTQYVLWFVPFIFIYLGLYIPKFPYKWVWSGIMTAYVILSTLLIFPFAWSIYLDGNAGLTLMLLLRNCTLLLITGYALYRLYPDSLKSSIEDTAKQFKITINSLRGN